MKILKENGFSAMTDMDEAVQKAVAARDGRKGRVSIFIDKNTTLVVQGITGRDGSFHTKQMIEYGTQVVAGVTPGKGGQKFEDTVPIFNTVAEAVQRDRREHDRHLRAAAVRRRCDHGSGGRRHRAHRLHHRRRAGARHDARLSVREGAAARACSARTARAHLAGQVEGRHHSRPHLHAGPDRRRQPLRHADLRSRLPAHARRTSVRPPASASAAIRSTARTSSIASTRSRRIRTRRPS